MTKPDDPAFAKTADHGPGGLTKREYFAAMAMQGAEKTYSFSSYQEIVEACVKLADALIAELSK